MSKILLSIFALILSFHCNSQVINGTVKDGEDRSLVEVNIVNVTNGKHTHTNESGVFELTNFNDGDTIFFSYIGHESQSIILTGNESELAIVLEQSDISLDDILILPGIDASAAIADVDIGRLPVNSSQEIIRQVPGVVIGQHAGGGKAEQIFLRGFDIDHGTDLQLNVDGIPVNLVSHAHGQGYADLHFIIPELIDDITYGKGPYDYEHGNFTTAGYIDFKTKDSFDQNEVKAEVGQFNTQRFVTMLNLIDNPNNSALFASEFSFSDGPFESPQDFNRINLFGKYSGTLSNSDRLSLTASHFTSRWDASGQIPQRAVDDGSISRFGAIDDTEGGETQRTNVSLDYHRHINETETVEANAYYSNYGFELYSNFTFFANDPVNGDQIRQRELRDLFGFNTKYTKYFSTNSLSGDYRFGLQARNDQSRENELSRTANRRETITPLQFGQVDETNIGAYADLHLDFGKLTINPSLRYDYFDFNYIDDLSTTFSKEGVDRGILSPKLNFLYSQNSEIQYFLKLGKGFHSNDSRVITEQQVAEILPAAYGTDVGFIWKPSNNFVLNTTAWYLLSEQEFVYVGDEAIVEASGESQRRGIEVSTRFQPIKSVFINADITYTDAESSDEPDGQDFIPLAPDLLITGGASVDVTQNLFASAQVRYLDDRPANEDNSIVAEGYTVVDFNSNYDLKKWSLGFRIQNLFDVDWNETQFATETRLQSETEPVDEIHFTPGTPFQIRGIASFKF